MVAIYIDKINLLDFKWSEETSGFTMMFIFLFLLFIFYILETYFERVEILR